MDLEILYNTASLNQIPVTCSLTEKSTASAILQIDLEYAAQVKKSVNVTDCKLDQKDLTDAAKKKKKSSVYV